MNAVFSTYDAAKRVGVAQPQVVKAIQVRRIKPLKEYADLDEFAADWERNVLSRKDVGHIEVDTEGKTLNQLRAEREVIARDMALLELEQKKGSLVYREAAQIAFADIVGRIKQAFMALPARHAPVLAAKYGVDPHAVYVDLDAMLREQLARIADEIKL